MTQRRPNVLFVFADQLRQCSVGFMGNPQVQTPRLDAFAQEGVVFTHAVSACPVCTPYRAALLTGRHNFSNGMIINDVRLPENERSIAHVLGDAGYDTAYIGKWHLDGARRMAFTPPGPRRQGFDYWAVANCTHDYMHSHYYRDDPEPIWIEGYDADHYTDLTVDYLRDREAEADPFCLFLSWGPPHEPYELMPPEYLTYDPAEIALRPNVTGDPRRDIAGNYGHITALDRCFGRILDALDEQGLAEDTLVVFTSDHGDMLGSHGQRYKQRPWEESIMVPFACRLPGTTPAGHRTRALINAQDIMPTLLDLAGVAIPETVEGVSLAAGARGAETCGPATTPLHNTCPFQDSVPEWRGVRSERHTFVRTLEGPWLLYDNEADPYQLANLVDRPQAAGVQRELDEALHGWLEEIGDDFQPREVYWERFGFDVEPSGHMQVDMTLGA